MYRFDLAYVSIVDDALAKQLVVLRCIAQRVQGVELGLSGVIGVRWHVLGGYAWQMGEITRAVYEMQLDGRVRTLDEAIAEAKKIISHGSV